MSKRTAVMVVMDGWGIGRKDNSNPIYIAKPENLDYIRRHYPAGSLQASGIAVGLPWGEEGNSEVGHLTLGAGKIVYQHFPRISLSIREGRFPQNEILLNAVNHAKQNGNSINLVGLLTEGSVHASIEHLQALIRLCFNSGLTKDKINLHLFTDARDSAPQAAPELINKLGDVKVASITGRFFAMDRDEHWDRTQATYNVITGNVRPGVYSSLLELFNTFYKKGYTDEFIEPTLIDPNGAIKENDSVVFFNFREDSMRQLASLFANPPTGEPQASSYICTFTKYSEKFPFPVAFPQQAIINPLGKVLSDNGLVQLRIGESVKYAHVTFFFNGYREPPFKNEFRILIPSRNVAHHDEYPQMMAEAITTRAVSAINEGVYDFILLNYANGDMIAHTGNYDAALTAIKTVDEQIGKLMKAVLQAQGMLLITSDHGNIERMLDPRTGLIETTHDSSPVPIYIVANGYERDKDDFYVDKIEKESIGVLADVAPTVLHLLGLKKPEEMTGASLLNQLR